jgi:nitrile hydratase accessory protein
VAAIGREAPGVFDSPWQAEVFALVVALHERGVFSWSEWAAALGRQVGSSDAAADGSDYYHHWLAALEALLAQKGVADGDTVQATADAWQRAARATPHGKAIVLENDPLSRD